MTAATITPHLPADVKRQALSLASGSPSFVCICGSSRFCDVMAVIGWEEEKKGRIALGCHLLPNWYWEQTNKTETGHGAEQEGVAEILDELHLRKIELAHEIIVANVGGYVGQRTRIEIEYAIQLGKPIRWYEPDRVPSWANVRNEPRGSKLSNT
jgi:hypothetical protein